MKTSFLHILIIICAVVWSLGAQAQRSIDLINDNDRVQLLSPKIPIMPLVLT